MRKIGFVVLYSCTLVILLSLIFVGCKQETKFYNVIYNQNGNIIEYYDVTNIYHYQNSVYFTTCDGATVFLADGAVEIIPLEVD